MSEDNSQLEKLESLIRAGLFGEAEKRLGKIGKVPRRQAVAYADIARRLMRETLAIKILSPIVRPTDTLQEPATPIEKIQYAASLRQLGAVNEARQLLNEVDTWAFPQAQLFKAFCFVSEWRYEDAYMELREYASHSKIGTSLSPIEIKYNKLRGGGPSGSGGGIMTGDNNASYITVDTNVLVNPGQYGIAVGGGHNNRIVNNKIYSSRFNWTNVGLYIWNQETTSCYGHELSGNRVNFIKSGGSQNAFWNAGNCGSLITSTPNVIPDLSISSAIWETNFSACGN